MIQCNNAISWFNIEKLISYWYTRCYIVANSNKLNLFFSFWYILYLFSLFWWFIQLKSSLFMGIIRISFVKQHISIVCYQSCICWTIFWWSRNRPAVIEELHPFLVDTPYANPLLWLVEKNKNNKKNNKKNNNKNNKKKMWK